VAVDFLWLGNRRFKYLGSPRSVALGSWVCVFTSAGAGAKGMKAGSSSSSSASSDWTSLFDVKRGGRRRRRLCAGRSDEDEESEELSSGEERGAGRGERSGVSIVESLGLVGFGERDLRFRVACAGRGLVCEGRFRDVTVVLADDVRENGGAGEVSVGNLLGTGGLPIARPGVVGILSFFGIGESRRLESADATRGPVRYKLAAFCRSWSD
jgi:hypothetical protein